MSATMLPLVVRTNLELFSTKRPASGGWKVGVSTEYYEDLEKSDWLAVSSLQIGNLEYVAVIPDSFDRQVVVRVGSIPAQSLADSLFELIKECFDDGDDSFLVFCQSEQQEVALEDFLSSLLASNDQMSITVSYGVLPQ